jgi:hypothetical protein
VMLDTVLVTNTRTLEIERKRILTADAKHILDLLTGAYRPFEIDTNDTEREEGL